MRGICVDFVLDFVFGVKPAHDSHLSFAPGDHLRLHQWVKRVGVLCEVLIDHHNALRERIRVPETALDLFRKALMPGETIHGKKKMRVDVWVAESIWENFLIKAMGWWIDSGRAPEHIIEMQLELDLGL